MPSSMFFLSALLLTLTSTESLGRCDRDSSLVYRSSWYLWSHLARKSTVLKRTELISFVAAGYVLEIM